MAAENIQKIAGLTFDSDTKTLEVTSSFVGTTDSGGKGVLDIPTVLQSLTTITSISKISASNYTKAIKITNVPANVAVTGGTGKDNISGSAGDIMFDGGAGADNITLASGTKGNYVNVSGANGADVIYNYSDGNFIRLGDEVSLTGAAVSGKTDIKLTVASPGSKVTSSAITIKNAAENKAPNQMITVVDSQYNTIASQLFGAATLTTKTALVIGGKLDASGNTTVTKIDYSDYESAVNIIGNAKNNTILAGKGSNTLEGGAGNDVFVGSGDLSAYATVDAEENDIYAIGTGALSKRLVLAAGEEDAYKPGAITYKHTAGSDTVYGFNPSKDTLYIAEGTFDSVTGVSVKNSDVTLTVSHLNGTKTTKSTIVLKDARNQTIKIVDGDHPSGFSLALRASSDFIITNKDVTNNAVTVTNTATTLIDASTAEYTSTTPITITGHEKASTIKASANADTLIGGAGNDVFYGYENTDSESGEVVKGANVTYVINPSDGNNTIYNYHAGDVIKFASAAAASSTVSISGSSFNAKTGDVTLTLANSILQTNGKYKTTKSTLTLKAVGTSLDTEDSRYQANKILYGNDTKITVEDVAGVRAAQTYGSSEITIAASDVKTNNTGKVLDTTGNTTAVTIDGSSAGAISIVGNAKNNSISGSGTLAGGTGNDTLVSDQDATTYIYSAGKDVIQTYTSGQKIKLNGVTVTKAATSYDATKEIADVILTLSNKGTLTIKNAINTEDGVVSITGKNNKITNYIKNTAKLAIIDANGEETKQSWGAANLQITNNDGNTIDASMNTTAEIISAGAKIVNQVDGESSISGFEQGDASHSRTSQVMLIGNTKANTLMGGSGGSTLTGGKGADVFVYDGTASDVITDYSATEKDKIKIMNGVLTSSKVDPANSNDIIINVTTNNTAGESGGNNSTTRQLRVVGGAKQKLTVIDDNGEETTQMYGQSELTVASTDGNTIHPTDNNVILVNASTINKGKVIIGNTSDNTLVGSKAADALYGNEANNSLVGNAGNDTLYGTSNDNTYNGGAGNDVFVYEGSYGNVVIEDYEKGKDRIRLESNVSIVSATFDTVSGAETNDINFKMSNNHVIKIKNARNTAITFDDVQKYVQAQDSKGNDLYVNPSTGKATTLDGDTDTGISFDASLVADIVTTSMVYASSEVTLSNTDVAKGAEFDVSSGEVQVVNAVAGKRSYAVEIIGNATKDNTILGGSGGNTITGGDGNDSLAGGNGVDYFVFTGGNDTIANYTQKKDFIVIGDGLEAAEYNNTGYNYYVDGNDVVLNFTKAATGDGEDEGTSNSTALLRIVNGKGAAVSIGHFATEDDVRTFAVDEGEDGLGGKTQVYSDYTQMILSKQTKAADSIKTTFATSDGEDSKISNESEGNVGANVKVFSAAAYAKNVGGITFTGNSNDQSIVGSAGDDFINPGSGTTNTIATGSGKDTIEFDGNSNVVVTDYAAGSDTILLGSGIELASATESQGSTTKVNDVTFTFTGTDKTLIIKNAISVGAKAETSKKITFATPTETYATVTTSQVYGGSDASTVTIIDADVAAGGTFDASKAVNNKVVTIDASKRAAKAPIEIIANSNANLIKGGKGADIIRTSGSSGNTLTGGAANDYFVFESSANSSSVTTNYITDYAVGDVIVIGSDRRILGSEIVAGTNDRSGKTTAIQLTIGTTLPGGDSKTSDKIIINSGASKAIAVAQGDVSYATDEDGNTYVTATNLKNQVSLLYGNNVATLSVATTDSDFNSAAAVNTYTTVTRDVSEYSGIIYPSTVTVVDASKLTAPTNKKAGYAANIKASTVPTVIKGGAGNDTLTGNTGNDSIAAGAGDDIINAGTGNNTITTGNGNDTIIYGGGTDIITDYTARTYKNGAWSGNVIQLGENQGISKGELVQGTKDKAGKTTAIKLTVSNINSTEDDGTIKWGKAIGTILIDSGASKKIAIANSAGDIDNSEAGYQYAVTSLTATSDTTKLDATTVPNAAVTVINASASKAEGVEIIGNSNANTITGSSGDDTITLNTTGANVVSYAVGAGDDKIANFTAANDKLLLTKGVVVSSDYDSDTKEFTLSIAKDAKSTVNGTLTFEGIESGTTINVVASKITGATSTYKAVTASNDGNDEKQEFAAPIQSVVEDTWFTAVDNTAAANNGLESIIDNSSANIATDYTTINGDAALTSVKQNTTQVLNTTYASQRKQ